MNADHIEQIAECLWQAEWKRAGNGGLRKVPWSEIAEVDRERFRFVAREVAALTALPAKTVVEGLEAAIRAAKLALFVINKQGIMPNGSWESGFNRDLATAEAALASEGMLTVEQIAESMWQTTLDAINDVPQPLATFTISIFEDRSTLHVNAAQGTAPDELLAKAKATLDSEAADLAKCPFHLPSEIDPVAFEAARNSFVMAEHRRTNITRKVLTAYIKAVQS